LLTSPPINSGAQVVFRSLLHPLFARFFSEEASIRTKAENAAKSQ
jgi:receptor expression-enhancing protein 5/6